MHRTLASWKLILERLPYYSWRWARPRGRQVEIHGRPSGKLIMKYLESWQSCLKPNAVGVRFRFMKKPGPQPEFADDIETVIRHWPYMPQFVRQTIVVMAKQFNPESNGARFPTPQGATWADIEIVLLSPKEAKITIGKVSQCYTFAALGLASDRWPEKPRAEWRMLRTYAENPQPDAYYRLPYRDSLKVETSKFRRWLQGVLRPAGRSAAAVQVGEVAAALQDSGRLSVSCKFTFGLSVYHWTARQKSSISPMKIIFQNVQRSR